MLVCVARDAVDLIRWSRLSEWIRAGPDVVLGLSRSPRHFPWGSDVILLLGGGGEWMVLPGLGSLLMPVAQSDLDKLAAFSRK